MFDQNNNGQATDNVAGGDNNSGTDFSRAMNDLANNDGGAQTDQSGQATPPAWGHPGQPIDNSGPVDNSVTPVSDQPVDNQNGEMQVQNFANPAVGGSQLNDDDLNKLVDLKQKALGELNPLVEHLDQNSEEKFNTLMMMIQASDDQSLLQQAYEVAQKITDDKARAQALLDVINEINYFTQR